MRKYKKNINAPAEVERACIAYIWRDEPMERYNVVFDRGDGTRELYPVARAGHIMPPWRWGDYERELVKTGCEMLGADPSSVCGVVDYDTRYLMLTDPRQYMIIWEAEAEERARESGLPAVDVSADLFGAGEGEEGDALNDGRMGADQTRTDFFGGGRAPRGEP